MAATAPTRISVYFDKPDNTAEDCAVVVSLQTPPAALIPTVGTSGSLTITDGGTQVAVFPAGGWNRWVGSIA